MKHILSQKRMLEKIVSLVLCLSVFSLAIGIAPLIGSAEIVPYEKIDLTGLLDETSNATTGTAAGRGAWDAENKVITVKSIFPDATLSTKASLIDGYKQGGLDAANGTSYICAANYTDVHVDEWIVLNLQKLYKVNQVGFTPSMYDSWYNGFPSAFTIEVSKDGQQWETVVTKTGYTASFVLGQQDYLFTFEEKECQYVRFSCTEIMLAWNGTLNVFGLQELEVFGEALPENPAPEDPAPDTGDRVALSTVTPGYLNMAMTASGEDNLGLTLTGPYTDTAGYGYAYWQLTSAMIAETPYLVVDLADNYAETIGVWCTVTYGWVNNPLKDLGTTEKQVIDLRAVMAENGILESDNNVCVCFTIANEEIPLVFEAFYLSKNNEAPENPDPENPDPENPDPENPDPENPDPENPNPENPPEEEVITGEIKTLEDGKLDFSELLGGKTGDALVGWDKNGIVITSSHTCEQKDWAPYNGKAFLVDGDTATEGNHYISCTYIPEAPYFIDVNEEQMVDEWIQIDLQKSFVLNRFSFSTLFAGNNFGLPADFKLELSEDGQTWSTAVSKAGFGMAAGKSSYEFEFSPRAARYVRFSVTKVADSYGATADPRKYSVILTELSLYAPVVSEDAGIRVLADGKLDFTPVLKGKVDADLVGWDADGIYITASHSMEQSAWAPYNGKGFLVDGNRATESNHFASCTYISESPFMTDVNTSQTVNEWIMFDLQEAYTLGKFTFSTLYAGNNFGMPADFKLEVSEDGQEWTTALEKTGFGCAAETSTYAFEFEPVTGRYVRLSVSKIADSYGATVDPRGYSLLLTEVELYQAIIKRKPEIVALEDGRLDFTALFEEAVGRDLVGWDAAGTYITSSHSLEQSAWLPYNGKAFLVDGIIDTDSGHYVSCTYDSNPPFLKDVNQSVDVDEWIAFDLQKEFPLKAFAFAPLYADNTFGMPQDFKVEVSTDGEEWTTVVNKTGYSAGVAQINTFAFDPVNARYVRFSVSKVAESYGATADPRGYSLILSEIQLYTTTLKDEMKVNVLENGKLDFTALFGGKTGNDLVGWETEDDYVFASSSMEKAGNIPAGLAFLLDGNRNGDSGFWASCTYDPDADEIYGLNTTADVDEWIYFNLRDTFKIGKFAFTARHQGEKIGLPMSFKLEVSEDGVNWNTVVEKTDYRAKQDTNVFTFEPREVQYMRFAVTKVAASDDELAYSVQLSELEFYETDGYEAPDTSDASAAPITFAAVIAAMALLCGAVIGGKKAWNKK